MKCSIVSVDGTPAIVCGARRYATKPCEFCGKAATKLCDAILEQDRRGMTTLQYAKLRTCDARLCDACAHTVAPGRDLCPRHRSGPAVAEPAQLDLGI